MMHGKEKTNKYGGAVMELVNINGNRSVNVGSASIGMTRRMRQSVHVRHALDSGGMSRR